jgi:opacity protein-like surface antigen
MNKSLLTLACCILLIVVADAQTRKQRYDSLLVGDRITPAVSSVMMPRSFTEVILSNTLLSSNQYFDIERKGRDFLNRTSYLFSTLQITRGISRTGRVNVGVDVNYRLGRADFDRTSSPLDVFSSSGDGLIQYERAFTSIGVRVRYVPVSKHRNFVVQNTFTIPLSTSSDANVFLGDSRYKLNTQFLYNYLIGRKVFLFGQVDALVLFKNSEAKTSYAMPVNLYVSYILNKNIIPFALLGTTNVWNDNIEQQSQSFSYGLGLQYQFTSMFTANFFYSDTFAGKNASQWQAFNLGVRGVF